MPSYEVAHLREQGQDIIIVVVDRSFGSKASSEQSEICANLQGCASAARLAGTVVPVWEASGGRMGFLAPDPWHPFFRNLTLVDVAANINRKLTCR
ncbi:MAG: hypothetical protein ACYC1C_13650 [Chloroflexota bacterium]